MAIKIEVANMAELSSALDRKIKALSQGIKNQLQDTAILIQQEVTASIEGNRAEPRSVDTGLFISSTDEDSNATTATIYNLTPYGPFLEYGTSKMEARGHFGNTIQRQAPIVVEKFKEMIKASLHS